MSRNNSKKGATKRMHFKRLLDAFQDVNIRRREPPMPLVRHGYKLDELTSRFDTWGSSKRTLGDLDSFVSGEAKSDNCIMFMITAQEVELN